MAFATRGGKLILRGGKLLTAASPDELDCCCGCPVPCSGTNNDECVDTFGDGRVKCENGCCIVVATCCVGGQPLAQTVPDVDFQFFCTNIAGGIFHPGLRPNEVPVIGGNILGRCPDSCCARPRINENGQPVEEVERISDGRTQPEACPICSEFNCCTDQQDIGQDGACPDGWTQFGDKCKLCGPSMSCEVCFFGCTPTGNNADICGSWVSDCGHVGG